MRGTLCVLHPSGSGRNLVGNRLRLSFLHGNFHSLPQLLCFLPPPTSIFGPKWFLKRKENTLGHLCIMTRRRDADLKERKTEYHNALPPMSGNSAGRLPTAKPFGPRGFPNPFPH
ncbi:hypothetical protein, unlikely [Trypanosoma brucei gambiense DAL972]|uniref:Uncharacterized protein n=1 Tax=Trypanosoma brucei gambiense (strain MHOM/CI/86/DAL972) TaxID=679716 RepID=D0A1R6_TRYB9|nr:hypothetical protein, unlikely [Trypanosoma brucei gambiense DAL972]CBH15209.1 hypothetical protein, unlikely [Trypanosoma brucei gambiense DAL972]|eukprot:XP_011777474.1 hypothetical protein, unlikely [Trypanosoma brucei gambiense DAL972]